MRPDNVAVVRIGDSEGRIVRITPKHIEYFDMAGNECLIALEECARNWTSWHSDHEGEFVPLPGNGQDKIDSWNARCVGERGALDDPPWVEFMNDRKTRFEFRSCEALYEELLGPLTQNGWHTFDTD